MEEKILLTDGNKEILQDFGGFLKSKGFRVFFAKDGVHALNISIRERPDIVICEVDLPIISGERLLRILKTNPNTEGIPFLFLSSKRRDVRGYRRNMDDLLLKPFNNSEMLHKIEGSFLKTKVRHTSSHEEKVIEGNLLYLSLVDSLQILSLNKKEGILKVFPKEGEVDGEVFIKNGNILNVTFGGLEGKKALFRLLTWQEGNFEFHPVHIKMESKFSTTTNNLIIEGLRQYDELKKLRENLPKDKSRLRVTVSLPRLPANLSPIVCEILCLLDTYQKVKELVEHSTYPDLEVYQSLADLICKGIIEEIKEENTLGGFTMKEHYGKLLTPYQAFKIREGLLKYWEGSEDITCAKVFILSTNLKLTETFIDFCKGIKEFTCKSKTFFYKDKPQEFFGEVGSLKVVETTEIVFFVLPIAESMRPIWKAFSHNVMGLILLWSREDFRSLKDISRAKRFMQMSKKIPVVHVFMSDTPIDSKEEVEFRRVLAINADEQIFTISPKTPERTLLVLYNLFGSFMKVAA